MRSSRTQRCRPAKPPSEFTRKTRKSILFVGDNRLVPVILRCGDLDPVECGIGGVGMVED